MEENNQSNSKESVQDTVIDSKGDFFAEMERQVNGGIIEEESTVEKEATPQQTGPPVATQQKEDPKVSSEINWEKSYKDSSREAQKMSSTLGELKPFIPVLEAMKQDSGLVDHVRDYLKSGGSPAKSVQDSLNLGEDFVYDAAEAMDDPNSDSAKVFQAHVDKVVNKRVGDMMTRERQHAQRQQINSAKKADEQRLREKYNMNDEEWGNFVTEAKERTLTLDDVYFLLNKDKREQNVAQETKRDMINQMRNVRDIPTSATSANSQSVEKSQKDDLFDQVLGTDSELDDMFGG